MELLEKQEKAAAFTAPTRGGGSENRSVLMLCKKCKLYDVEPSSTKTWCKICRTQARATAREWKRTHPKKLYSGNSYASRDVALKQMGFRSYAEYLRSDLWKAVRTKVYKTKGYLCQMCGSTATQVHHNRYHKNDLMGDTLTYLVPICRGCHERIEFSKKKHKKLELHQVKDNFYKSGVNHLKDLLLNHDAEL